MINDIKQKSLRIFAVSNLQRMKTYQNQSLKSYNTFAIDAHCQQLIEIEKEEEISQLFDSHIFEFPHLIIGGGSNMLFTKDFEGTIIQLKTKGIRLVSEDDAHVWIEVAAGETWADFVSYCIENEYYGVENLVGIPGLVGSCPVQNIGAYNVEVKDVIDKVFGFYLSDAAPFALSHSDCRFGYRNSIFKTELKGQCLITKVRFQLSKKEHFTITYKGLIEELESQKCPITLRNVANAILTVRNRKLPDIREIGCAGSFFQNPIIPLLQFEKLQQKFPNLVFFPTPDGRAKLAAGQLIELCGLKGTQENNVGVYPKQALVIVNYGGATGKEVRDFYTKVQQKVFETFDIQIIPEVNIY